jgi:hypothetical protein
VQWPFIGWGIGVIAHALMVFGNMPTAIINWQLRKIKQLKDRMCRERIASCGSAMRRLNC